MAQPTIGEAEVIKAVPDGAYTILDPIVTVRLSDGSERDIALAQKWPIRVPRPTYKRFPASVPLVTGQRIQLLAEPWIYEEWKLFPESRQ